MRKWLFVCLLGASIPGCFSPKYRNGDLQCQSGTHPCPEGYHCASDSTCWKNGADPVSIGDMGIKNGDMTVANACTYGNSTFDNGCAFAP